MAITPFDDEHKVRGTIRDIIRDNRKAKGMDFLKYTKFLLSIRREIETHLISKGVLVINAPIRKKK
jgi:hypothetical protein